MQRVSVVIPTFNRASLVAGAVDSALAQTHGPTEVIVVDDGSTDGTADLLDRRFGAAIRVERLPRNQGRSAARNRGWALADGDFVAFLDSDDVWDPDKLERQLPLFDQPRVDLVHGWIRLTDTAGRPLRARSATLQRGFERALARGYDYAGITETWCMMWTSTVVVRRELPEAADGFDPALDDYEDWDLFWRIARRGVVATVPECVAAYRARRGHDGIPLPAGASQWVTVNARHLTDLAHHPDVPRRDRARRNLLVNLALGERWRGNARAARRWALAAARAEPALLWARDAPDWQSGFLEALLGRRGAAVTRRFTEVPAPAHPEAEAAHAPGRRPSPPETEGRRSMTVVVISYQRRATLARLLLALARELHADPALRTGLDVLVVLDGSDDGSIELVEGLSYPVPLRHVWQPNRGRAAARNAGLRAAGGELVLLLDDDGSPAPGLLAGHRLAHDDAVDQVVIGPCDVSPRSIAPTALIAHSRQHFARLAAQGRARVAYDVTFANTSAPRQLLLELGGFDESFVGWGAEDGEFGHRILLADVPVVFRDDCVVHHDVNRTRRQFLRMTAELGANTSRMIDRHPDLADLYLSPRVEGAAGAVRVAGRLGSRACSALGAACLIAGPAIDSLWADGGTRLGWLAWDAGLAAGLLRADTTGRHFARFTAHR
jgi:glycosyltransferase involved in cell wall biosynthesis